jgi:hypothetical protein
MLGSSPVAAQLAASQQGLSSMSECVVYFTTLSLSRLSSFDRMIANNDLETVWRPARVKEDEMGRACSTNGGEEECIKDIGGKARRKETTGKTKT